jgi:hypothetical protein
VVINYDREEENLKIYYYFKGYIVRIIGIRRSIIENVLWKIASGICQENVAMKE